MLKILTLFLARANVNTRHHHYFPEQSTFCYYVNCIRLCVNCSLMTKNIKNNNNCKGQQDFPGKINVFSQFSIYFPGLENWSLIFQDFQVYQDVWEP